ncbi:MAG: aminopeptidase P family protein [Clostridia bacterium]|nr:aminopeptidase P family protein [Clostridia bacterium]
MINQIKNFLKGRADSALIISKENVKYLTSFSSSNGYLLITPEKSVFLTDSRYIEAAEKTIKTCDEICEIKSVEKTLSPIVKKLKIRTMAVEQSRMTLSQLESFKKSFSEVSFLTNSLLDDEIDLLRSVKTKEESEKIEKAQRIAEKAFLHVLGFIKPGVTEKEIALELDYYMLRNGAEALSFETIAVSGKNSSMPHGVPGEKKIEKGDFITMDFGAVFEGYHSDMTRTVAVGEVSDKQAEVYNIVLEAQKAGLEKIRAGVPCNLIDKAARDLISSKGYGEFFGHGYGHGVGIEIHEYPRLSPFSQAVLKEGNVVTAEPGIYLPGEFGVRIEDMVIVTENGYYNYTKSDKELIIL